MRSILKASFPLLFSLLALSSCGTAASTSAYEVRTDNKVEVRYEDTFKRQYEDGELLSIEGLSLYFDGTLLDESSYFFTKNTTTPVESKIDLSTDKMTSSSQEYVSVSIYAAYQYEPSVYYVSDAITLEVRNQNAATPWITTVVGAVVFVAIAALLTIKIYHDTKGKGAANKDNKTKK